MNKLIILLIVFTLSSKLFSQKFGPSYIKPDDSSSFISIYLSVNNLKKINPKTKRVKKAKNSFNYFAFRITKNTIFYDTKYKSLIGSFIYTNSKEDTLNFFMSENNGDLLDIKIFYNDHDKVVVLIEERKLNNKIKIYYSDECILTRKCI